MTWDVSLTMTEKWDATSLPAGKPATGPMAPDTTGTSFIAWAMILNLGSAYTGEPTVVGLAPPEPATLPPPPSSIRTSGTLNCTANSSA